MCSCAAVENCLIQDEVFTEDQLSEFLSDLDNVLLLQGQSKLGRVVSGMRFQTSPHVDHFRNNTLAYTEGLRRFVADALVLTDLSWPSSRVMPHLRPAICIPEAL